MVGLLLRWAIGSAGLWVAAALVSGISFSSTGPLLIAALVLGILNAVVRPILVLLTLPVTVVTLGLFLFVINAGMLKLTSAVVDGFQVDGFWSAIFGALVLSLVSLVLNMFVSDSGGITTISVDIHRN
ncbi:MAG: phage holin family protein [Candidatus Binatia bacterium]|nr:phage holin family protein [Candidatus Binatia bacterium]